jgi:flagellin
MDKDGADGHHDVPTFPWSGYRVLEDAMAMVLNTNMTSLNAQRVLGRSTSELGKTFERLSSGLRINHAADDSAGLAISTRMTAQIRGISQAIRNTNDAISLLQVSDGSLSETTNALQRIRELTVQAANDTYTSGDRADIQKEINQLLGEITRIADHTMFNGQKLLDGTYQDKRFQVGAYSGQFLSINIGGATASAIGADFLSGTVLEATSGAAITAMISQVDVAMQSIADLRSNLGAYYNRFEATVHNLSTIMEGMSAARSRITDADIAAETSALTRSSILQQSGAAMLAQANQQPQVALVLLANLS